MQKNELKKGSDWAGLACPFPVTNEARLKMFCLFFWPVVVGLPWYLEPPAAYRFEGDCEPVRFIYPPEDLKPDPDFQKQAAHFKRRSLQNQEVEPNAYLKTGRNRENVAETSREIELVLRGLPSAVSPETQNRGRLWNLTLHLAHEVETRKAEADQILAQIRTRPSPLTVLQEVEEVSGFFTDLPPLEPDVLLSEQQTEQVFAAWGGLFENQLAEYPFLLLDRREAWEFLSGIGEADQAVEITLEFLIPDPTQHSLQALLELWNATFKPQHLEAFHKALNVIVERPREAQAELARVAREIERALPTELKTRQLRMRIKELLPLADSAYLRNRPWLTTLFNKVLIYMECDG